MGTETKTIDRSVDHVLDTELSADEALATLSDREEHRLQMQEIKRRTVKPGVMKLNVNTVTSAENSEQWAIDIEHPARKDDIRVFVEKPIEGWSRDYTIVRVLEWYGITNQDPHQLEFEDVYVRKDEAASDYAHGWVLTEPPDYEAPMRVQLRKHKERFETDYRPSRTNAKMWGVLLTGAVVGAILPAAIGDSSIAVNAVTTGLMFVFATIVGMAVMDNE